jgi:hypothetical protein
MNQIDPESAAFIERVEKKFEDKDAVYDILKALLKEVEYFYMHQPYEILREKVLVKMHEGALTYKQLEKRSWKIRQEKDQEKVDLIGWNFLLMAAEDNL